MALADLNIRIGIDPKKFDAGLIDADKKLRKWSRKMSDLGEQLSTTFSAAFAAFGVASVKAFGDFERLEKGLAAVTKSTVPVNEQIARLKELAEAPGLGFEQAVTAATRLQAVGFSAQFAEKTIKEVANAVATTGGTADNFDSVLKQFTQMIAKGKLLQEDLGIIQENMPIVSQAIQDAFGTNNVEKIRATGVSAQEFVQKVVGELGNLKRVEGGLSNSMDNLGQSLRSFFATVGKEINEAFNLQDVFDRLGDSLNGLATWFASLDDNVQRNIIRFALFAAGVGPVLFILGKMAAVGQVMVLGFQNLTWAAEKVGAAFTFLTSPIGLVIAIVTALAVAGVYLYKNWDSAKAAFTNIWIGIKNFFLKTINSMLKGIDSFTSAATFGVAGTNLAEKFSFKTEDYVDVPKWKSFGATMKEVGGDLLEYAGLAGKAKQKTKELNSEIFAGDTGPAITGGDVSGGGEELSDFKKKLAALKAERQAFDAILKKDGASPTLGGNRISNIEGGAYSGLIQLGEKYQGVIQGIVDQTSALNVKNMDLKISQDSINASLNTSFPLLEQFKSQVESLGLVFDQITEKAIPNFSGAVSQGLSAFSRYAEDGISSMRDLSRAVVAASLTIIKSLIQQGVAAAVANALKNPAGIIPPVGLALAGAAGAAAAGLFQGLIGKIGAPKLAKGGLAYGSTLAVVGDNPNAKADPEVIAPLSKLRSYLETGGGGGVSEIFLRGEDLVLAMERTNARRSGRIK